jgi:NlpC/P60 family putative phage cell wall peptidase
MQVNKDGTNEIIELGLKVASEARSWIGTPYRHQCTAMGQGADCLGLIRGIWRSLYGDEPLSIPAYSMDWSEPNREERLMNAAHQILEAVRIDDMLLGDVLLFRMRDGSVAKHLGILSKNSSNKKFIHAYTRYGVVESSLSMPWSRRLAAVFRFPIKKREI